MSCDFYETADSSDFHDRIDDSIRLKNVLPPFVMADIRELESQRRALESRMKQLESEERALIDRERSVLLADKGEMDKKIAGLQTERNVIVANLSKL